MRSEAELWGTADEPGRAELSELLVEANEAEDIWSLIYMIGYGADRGMFGYGIDREEFEGAPNVYLQEALQELVDSMEKIGFVPEGYKVTISKGDSHG